MAIAKLEFDLSNMEDELKHYQCVNAENMAMALWEISNNLRKKVEWDVDSNDKDPIDIVFERIYGILQENGIIVDKISR